MKIRTLSEDLQKIACEELNEKPENIAAELQAFRSWIAEQPHLKARTDDQWLLTFLRGCKHNLEKAQAKFDKYYQIKTKHPECFKCTDVDDADVRALFRDGLFFPLPMPLHGNGARVMMLRYAAVPAGKYPMEVVFRCISLIHQLALIEDDNATTHGFMIIIDSTDFSARHMWQWSPNMLGKLMSYTEKSLPLRQRAVYMINSLATFEMLYKLIRPVLPKKQQDRMHMYSTKLDNFYKIYPKKYLPAEYGGENGSIAEIIENLNKKLDDYREYFKQEANYGTDESLRSVKPGYFKQIWG